MNALLPSLPHAPAPSGRRGRRLRPVGAVAPAAALAAAALLAAPCAAAAELEVAVEGVGSDQGQVMVGLFGPGDDFPNQARSGQRIKAVAGQVATVRFTGLAPGRYAVSVFHDRNDNGRLDRGRFGIPEEPYGFSRDARGIAGPPDFADAAVELGDGGQRLLVRVR